VSKVQRILQENSKTIKTMALQDHSCAQITAMWFSNFCKCNLQSVEDGELPSKLVFFQVLFEWIREHTKQIMEYKNSILYTWLNTHFMMWRWCWVCWTARIMSSILCRQN